MISMAVASRGRDKHDHPVEPLQGVEPLEGGERASAGAPGLEALSRSSTASRKIRKNRPDERRIMVEGSQGHGVALLGAPRDANIPAA